MIAFLIFIFVMVVTAILFGSWVMFSIGKLIWRAFAGPSRPINQNGSGRPCMNAGCRAGNPLHAHFCRRCGSDLREPIFVNPTSRANAPLTPRFNPTSGRERERQPAGNMFTRA